MGQDTEEAAEFVATVRTEHAAMKTWYMAEDNGGDIRKTLREKYGSYPQLWKEVLNWNGWKETRKEYLKQQQQQQSSSSVPRKRKSRWGSASSDNNSNGSGNDSSKRQSRWNRGDTNNGNTRPPVSLPGLLPGTAVPNVAAVGGVAAALQNLPPHKQEEMKRLQGRLRFINDKMSNLEVEAARVDALPREHPDRSPSPPPIYGADGKRKNTRAERWRQRFTVERQDLLEKIMNLNPQTRGQSNLFVSRKRSRKIRVPVDKHPTYNFIGLILGPRGKTQKELEAKTGCKIAIRGRGSMKEGARGRRDGKVMEGENEPLHVVITGDDQNAVDAASEMIEQMLVVIDDEKNVHKQQQLRELALLNGTLKEEEFCQICAEKGHRSFECPRRFTNRGKSSMPAIKCAICGDTSHPTRDCTQKRPADQLQQPQQPNKELDSDYMSFMAELDGKKAEPVAPAVSAQGPPPLTGGLPPPPNGGAVPPPPPPINLPLPPPPKPMEGGLPPPPPPAGASYPPPPLPPQGNQGFYGAGPQHQPPPGQQPGYPPHPGPAPQAVRPGEETSGWDPSSYYGSYDASGAGGFNWWEQ